MRSQPVVTRPAANAVAAIALSERTLSVEVGSNAANMRAEAISPDEPGKRIAPPAAKVTIRPDMKEAPMTTMWIAHSACIIRKRAAADTA